MANDVSKEQMQQDIKAALERLRHHQLAFTKLLDNLVRTVQGGDVSFAVIEDAAALTDGLPEMKEVLSELTKSLKARAKSRMKDL